LSAVDAQTKMEPMPGNVSQQQPVEATSWAVQE
jgi:hypothetical protein